MKREKTRVKIMISIPKELADIVSELVENSKKTPRPISKSAFYAVAAAEYLSAWKRKMETEVKGGKVN